MLTLRLPKPVPRVGTIEGRKSMSRTFRNSVSLGAAALAAAGLVGAGGAAAVSAPHAHPALAATPKLSVTMSKKQFSLTGPRTFQAGRVAVSLKAEKGDHTIQIVSFKKGYTFAHLRSDLLAFGEGQGPTGESKSGLRHLNNAVRHTHLYGGFDADNQTISGTVVLPKAGKYVLYDDSSELPARPKTLTVTGPEVARATPHSDATVIATSAKRFRGSKTLPSHGTITFKNESTNSPHMLILQHVKQGTTRKEVISFLNSGSNGNPPFGRAGSANTDILGEGQSQTLTYHHLPKGEYVELCFFPDLQTGMPHAAMGMVNVVTVK
jgi:hypothetical protein